MHYLHQTIAVLLLVSTVTLNAQSKLNIGVKGGLLLAKEEVAANDIGFTDVGSYNKGYVPNAAVFFSLPVIPKFRLGAEAGFYSYRTYFNYHLKFPTNITFDYKGDYRIDQYYFAVVPEFRPLKWIFFNGGIGYFADSKSEFLNGTRQALDQIIDDIEDITGFEYKRSSSLGYFIGGGVCPNVGKRVAVLAEARYAGSPAAASGTEKVGVGYSGINFNIGVMFKID